MLFVSNIFVKESHGTLFVDNGELLLKWAAFDIIRITVSACVDYESENCVANNTHKVTYKVKDNIFSPSPPASPCLSLPLPTCLSLPLPPPPHLPLPASPTFTNVLPPPVCTWRKYTIYIRLVFKCMASLSNYYFFNSKVITMNTLDWCD